MMMRSNHRLSWSVLAVGVALVAYSSAIQPSCADSKGIIVESVNEFGSPPCDPAQGTADICNSIANGDGFLQGIVFPGSIFFRSGRWTDGTVYDTDFVDPEANALGNDTNNFDKPGTAISYLTAHGILDHGCSTVACSTTSACTQPNTATGPGVPRLPGTCRFSPLDSARCCYMVDRAALVKGTGDRFGGLINYTGGAVRWGESPQAGGWAGAGTNGGTNVVVLDISHGVLPTFWYQTFQRASAGVQLILTIMTAGGDTANTSQRGSTFAAFYRANPGGSVAQAWKDTMNSLPASPAGGNPCPGGGGGHGFNGCGCNVALGFDSTEARAKAALRESWFAITNDNNDALGNRWLSVEWQCNYPLPATDHTAWERP
jgi:hypothetical protein